MIITLKLQQSRHIYRKDLFFTHCLFLLPFYFPHNKKTETGTYRNIGFPNVSLVTAPCSPVLSFPFTPKRGKHGIFRHYFQLTFSSIEL